MNPINFTVYAKPQPQGSSRAFVIKGRAVVTSSNKKLKPYRQEVSQVALSAREGNEILFGKHQPVELQVQFYISRPPSIPKKRIQLVVKPDLDKLIRAVNDALTGIIYQDDAQVVRVIASKHYGQPERTEIAVRAFPETAQPETKKYPNDIRCRNCGHTFGIHDPAPRGCGGTDAAGDVCGCESFAARIS